MSRLVQIGMIRDDKLDIRNIFFDENLDTEILAEITATGVFFRIPNEEDIEYWNDFVEKMWPELDDYYFYGYETPCIHNTEWNGYKDTYLYRLQPLIKKLTENLDYAKDFSSKVAYMK